MEYMIKNVFGLRWNCRELKGIVKLRLFRSTQQYVKSGVAKYLGVAGIQQQNRNMGFNESGEYKKTFIGSGVGTGSMQVLHVFEFEVKPLGDHTVEVEPQENIDQGASLQETIWMLGQMCMCSATVAGNAMTTSMAITRSIHQEYQMVCTILDIASVDVGMLDKFDHGLQTDVHVFVDFDYAIERSITVVVACEAAIWATKGLLDKAKGNVLGMEIVRDQSGNSLRVSQSRFYNEKLVQTLLEGHSILSLEGSLSGDCNVEKNGKWSCIYAVGSQEYQMVCMRLDIASIDVGYGLMILGCARSLKANLQHIKARSTTKATYMTFTDAWKKEIWLKGLLTESRYELRLVAGILLDALIKVVPGHKLQHCLELLSVGIG
nr:zinc finger, CCHC-type [Tanacetum cinerariifolium]